jgi:hypothetical protein
MSVSISCWINRVLEALALALVVATVLGFSYEQIVRSRDSQHRFRVGRAVDLGNRTLNISCAGSGLPAVIFESGGNGERRIRMGLCPV